MYSLTLVAPCALDTPGRAGSIRCWASVSPRDVVEYGGCKLDAFESLVDSRRFVECVMPISWVRSLSCVDDEESIASLGVEFDIPTRMVEAGRVVVRSKIDIVSSQTTPSITIVIHTQNNSASQSFVKRVAFAQGLLLRQ